MARHRSVTVESVRQAAARWLDTHSRVLRELATLPKNQQEVVRLKFQNGLSYEEISALTEQTPDAVRGKLHRARKAFTTLFEKTG